MLPIFLYLMLGVLFFVQFMETAGATEQKIHDRAKQMAVYAYDSRKITDQDFHLGYSTFSGKEDEIDLVAAYRISSQMPVFSFGKPQIIQRGFVRAWTGRDFRKELQKEGNEESKEKVFVTAHGTVYHKSLKCTHLRLSVEQTTVNRQKPEEIAMERNIMPVHAVNPELVQQFILQIPAIVIMPDCLAAD